MRLIIEILAVVFSLLCVILTIKRKLISWPIGILGVIFYFIVFVDRRMYAESILQILFFIQGVVGWINWHKNFNDDKCIHIHKLDMKIFIFHIFITIISSILIGLLFWKFTNDSSPLLDSIFFVFSLVANYYLIKRWIQSWYLWFVIDIGYVVFFFYNDMYISSVLYLVFFVMAVFGFIEWRKKMLYEKV